MTNTQERQYVMAITQTRQTSGGREWKVHSVKLFYACFTTVFNTQCVQENMHAHDLKSTRGLLQHINTLFLLK